MKILNGICHEGEGGGPRVPLKCFQKNFFFFKHLASFPDCQNVFCTKFDFIFDIYIVVDVTMIRAEYTSSWQSAARAAEECQYLNQL